MTTTTKPTFIPTGLLVGIFLLCLAGFVDGAVEGFEFDGRMFFELRFKALRGGFWGSQSWTMVYVGGDPANGFKTLFHRWLGAIDFYHICDDLRKTGYVIGGILVGVNLGRFKGGWRWGVIVGAMVAASALKALGMWAIRI